MACRICGDATRLLLDLGSSPPANSLKQSPDAHETLYPLVVDVCDACGNVQLRDCIDASALYSTYLYVTPASASLTRHYEYLSEYLSARGLVDRARYVLEIGSNNGLFLRHLQPCVRRVVGVDPAANICEIANRDGIPTVCDFFDLASAGRLKAQFGHPDLIVARHCLAHNADPHKMLAGVTHLLPEGGYLLVENAYLLETVEHNEFDQIYHEHMFYYTIRSMSKLLALHGMRIVDVLMAPVHGGSIVVLAKKAQRNDVVSPAVRRFAAREEAALTRDAFERFVRNTRAVKRRLRGLVRDIRAAGESIYTYGATAKGNTLLNFVGLTVRDIAYCVDSTPLKQGRYLPKANIPVISEDEARRHPPDYFLLTAWNYEEEIIEKVRSEGNRRSRFIVPIPHVHTV